MINLFFLLLCLVVGILLKKYSILPPNAHITLNNVILYVCLPATSLIYGSTVELNSKYLLAIAMPWLLYGGSVLFFRILRRFTKIHPHSEGVLIMTSAIPSISFVGFPIFQMLYGEEGLRIGVLMSQAGSFLACSTLGIITASLYASQNPSYTKIVKDVLTFPTFIAFSVAIAMNCLGIHFSENAIELLRKFSTPFTFLALLSVGFQIELSYKALQKNNLRWGLLYKLCLAPLLVFVLFYLILGQRGQIVEACVLGAGIGSMNMTAVIALRYNLNPTLASQMVGIGIPLSLGVVYLLHLYF